MLLASVFLTAQGASLEPPLREELAVETK